MVDWNIVAKIAGGGFGVTILVLLIIAVVAWIVGLVIRKFQANAKEVPAKKAPEKKEG